jgi:hypothetical protein
LPIFIIQIRFVEENPSDKRVVTDQKPTYEESERRSLSP